MGHFALRFGRLVCVGVLGPPHVDLAPGRFSILIGVFGRYLECLDQACLRLGHPRHEALQWAFFLARDLGLPNRHLAHVGVSP